MILNYTEQGTGPVIVLLHGMAGSLRYWNQFLPYLGGNYRIISLDLLGFGHSPKPKDTIYNYKTHVKNIHDTLEHIGVQQPFTLVGHSMGGLVALRFATKHHVSVSRLILVAVPLYATIMAAHVAITGNNKLKELAYYGWTSKLLCSTWCGFLRPISSRLAPAYLPHLTPEAAQDSVLHTWQSYSQSLHYILEQQNVPKDLKQLDIPIVFVYGDKDIPKDMTQIIPVGSHQNVQVVKLKGTHQIINEQPAQISQLIDSEPST